MPIYFQKNTHNSSRTRPHERKITSKGENPLIHSEEYPYTLPTSGLYLKQLDIGNILCEALKSRQPKVCVETPSRL